MHRLRYIFVTYQAVSRQKLFGVLKSVEEDLGGYKHPEVRRWGNFDIPGSWAMRFQWVQPVTSVEEFARELDLHPADLRDAVLLVTKDTAQTDIRLAEERGIEVLDVDRYGHLVRLHDAA